MTETGTVVAIGLDGEAKAFRELTSGFIPTSTRCKVVTDDGRTILAAVWTLRSGDAKVDWFRQKQPRVRRDEYGVWNVCDETPRAEGSSTLVCNPLPNRDLGLDGWRSASPVDAFEAYGLGLLGRRRQGVGLVCRLVEHPVVRRQATVMRRAPPPARRASPAAGRTSATSLTAIATACRRAPTGSDSAAGHMGFRCVADASSERCFSRVVGSGGQVATPRGMG